jgi:hypothetical protein
MAKLWSQRTYKQASSGGTTITLDIPVSIGQHLWWPKMRNQITNSVTVCSTCQINKRKTSKKFEHLPEKEAEAIPWDKMCIDLTGPYNLQKWTKQLYANVSP